MKTRHVSGLAGLALAGIAAAPASAGDEAPRSYVASPDVYKVIAQNDKTKVILVSWQPGKWDNWHSHPANNGVYFLTDCEARIYTPDGKYRDVGLKAGDANVQAAIPSHAFENRGTTECRMIIIEQD